MNSIRSLSLLIFLSTLSLPFCPHHASGGDQYASFWRCSDGNTYGLVAKGSRRELYLPTGASPLFFSGVKNGQSYSGTIYLGSEAIPVSGPVSRNDTRVTLTARDGRTWVLNFSHK